MANPGKLDRRIVIQVRTLTQDGTGTRSESWATLTTVWAELVKDAGKQAILAQADRTQTSKFFRVRAIDINETDHRITYKGKTYEIKGITEEGRDDTLLLDVVATEEIS